MELKQLPAAFILSFISISIHPAILIYVGSQLFKVTYLCYSCTIKSDDTVFLVGPFSYAHDLHLCQINLHI